MIQTSPPRMTPSAAVGERTAVTISATVTASAKSPTSLTRIDATRRPVGTTRRSLSSSVRATVDAEGAGVAPRARASSRSRSGSTSASGRYARRPVLPVEPPIRRRSSATRNSRASPGRTTSTDWSWESGNRSERRRIRPVSISTSSSTIRQRVTSHEMKPSTISNATTPIWMYTSIGVRSPRNSVGRSTITIAIVPRPPRTTGDSGCSRSQGVSVTARPPGTLRARRAGRAASPPPRA